MGGRSRRRRKNRRGERAMLKRKREGAEKRDFDWTKSLILCPDRKIVLDVINQSKTGKLNILLRNYTEEDLQKNDENLFLNLESKSIFTSKQKLRKISEKNFLLMLQKTDKERPLVDLS